MNRTATLFATALLLSACAQASVAQDASSPAPFHPHTVHFTSQQLDEMSLERQKEIGYRDWGPPPKVTMAPIRVLPAPEPVVCMSPAHAFENLYAEPSTQSQTIGIAGNAIAATHQTRQGWRRILHAGRTYGWMPNEDVIRYKPLVPAGWSHCTVVGETPRGMVMFDYEPK
jgi:hypothetical protein